MDNHIHQQILRVLRTRLALILRLDEDNIPCQSVGDLVNIIFLLNGQYGCIGDYGATMRAVHTLLGSDLLWAKPEARPEGENSNPMVN